MQEAAPAGSWSTLAVLGAMTTPGLLASRTVESPTDGDVFLAHLDALLCPCPQVEQMVIADHLSAHKVDGVRDPIEAAGAVLLYLPLYPPDFNPIAKAWSKIKQRLRKVQARTLDWLEEAVAEALHNGTFQDAAGWFRPCGYAIR